MLVLFLLLGVTLCTVGSFRFDTDIFLAGVCVNILTLAYAAGGVLHFIFH